MPIKFNLQMPDGTKVAQSFGRFAVEVEESMPAFLRGVSTQLEQTVDLEFETRGAHDGGVLWPARSPVSNMIRRQQGLEQNGPLLEMTGRLREALTNSAAGGALRAISQKSMVWGTQGIPYATFHQFGTRQKPTTEKRRLFMGLQYGWWMKRGHVITMPARPPLDIAAGKNRLRPIFKRRLTGVARDTLLKARQKTQLPVNWDREIGRDFDLRIETRD